MDLRVLKSVIHHKGQKTSARKTVQVKGIYGEMGLAVSKKYGINAQLIAAQTGYKIVLKPQKTRQIILKVQMIVNNR